MLSISIQQTSTICCRGFFRTWNYLNTTQGTIVFMLIKSLLTIKNFGRYSCLDPISRYVQLLQMGLYTGKRGFQNIYDRHWAVSYSSPNTCTLNHNTSMGQVKFPFLATWGVKCHHFRFRSTWPMVTMEAPPFPFPVHVANGYNESATISVSGPRVRWKRHHFRFRSTWTMVTMEVPPFPFPVHVVNGCGRSATISVSGSVG